MDTVDGADVAEQPPVPAPEFRSGWRGSTRLVHGPFRTLILGQGAGQLGDGLAQVAFAQLVVFDVGHGATPGRIASVLAVTLLPFSVVGPLAGVFIDRWDRRRTLITASLFRAALSVIAIAAAIWRSEPAAYVGVVLLLSSSRFVLDAKGSVLPRTVEASELVRANAISALFGTAAAFIGFGSGALFVSWSVAVGFLGATGAYLVASTLFARLPDVGGGVRSDLAAALLRLLHELRDGGRAIATTAQLRRPLAAVWAHRLLLGGGFVLLILVADRRYHLTTSGYALALLVTGVAAVAGTVSAPWLAGRWPAPALLPLAFLPPAAAAIVTGYAPTLTGLVAAVAVTAVSFQVLKVLTDALVGRAAPDAVRGRVFAIYDVLYNLAFVLAGLAMVPLWHLGRERALLWWLAAAFVAGWLACAWVVRGWPFGATRAAPVEHGRWRMRGVAVLTGAVAVVIYPAPSLWWAAWFVFVPWLIVVRRAPTVREAALRGWWAAVGFLLAVHYWLAASLTAFLPLATAFIGLLWLPWAALTWRVLSGPLSVRRLAAALAVVPAGWVLIEAVRSWSALGGPWGLLGASQWRAPALLAPASLGGVWLVSFLIVATNVALTALVESAALRIRAVAVAVAVSLVAAGPLWYAAQPKPHATAHLDIAIVQAGVVHGPAERLDDELAATDRLAPNRYGLVIWGESSVGFDLVNRPDLQRRLAAESARLGADLLVNVDAAAPGGAIRKTAVLVGPDGIKGSYQKMRLVPFGEYIPLRFLFGWLSSITKAAGVNRVRGDHLVTLRTKNVTFAPLICFESAFPDQSRNASRDGADLLIFQSATTTFQGSWAPNQHASLAAVRAVETGRTAVHATLAGTSAAFDARGHRLLWWPDERGTAVVSVPLATRSTPYDRFGDWLLACSVVVLAVTAIALSLAAAREDAASVR